MCKWGDQVEIDVPKTGRPEANALVDRCIAPLIEALNRGGVPTVTCCCGHGKNEGSIELADGRILLLLPESEKATYVMATRMIQGSPAELDLFTVLSTAAERTTERLKREVQ